MRIAIVADPHVSLLTKIHYGLDLSHTQTITAAVVAELNVRRPDLVIWLGDLTHENTDEARQRFIEIRAGLNVANLALVGNHDVQLITKHDFGGLTPIVRRQWWHVAGWSLVMVDTVRELAPHDSSGHIDDATEAFLREAALDAAARQMPLLVLGHQPPMPEGMKPEGFWRAMAGVKLRGVFIGGHTHVDRVRRAEDPAITTAGGEWTVIEVASCCVAPTGYRLLTLQPGAMALDAVKVEVDGLVLPFKAGVGAGYPMRIPAAR